MPLRTTLTCLLLCFSAPALLAAEIQLRGTSGALLTIDGEAIGQLPLAAPLQLPEGDYELRLTRPGYRAHYEQLSVLGEGLRTFDVELLPLHPGTAAASSLVLAGLGQIYSGRPRTGAVFMGLQLTAAVGAVLLESEYKSRREDYQRAQLAYANAIDPEEIAELRPAVSARWNDMNDLEGLRDGVVYSVFAIAAISALEAWWNFPELELSAQSSGEGVQVGWGVSF